MYKPVDKYPDLVAIERRLLAFWDDQRIFETLRQRNAGGPRWSFLDGPITANNPMGVHHAWGRSYKDMFQRYHAMRGFELRYQNGFDCQGLWVEVEVEKELGFETKADIVAYGIDRFVAACKQRVLTFAARQTEQSKRLGYWMMWDDPDTLRALRDALAEGTEQMTIVTPSGKRVTGSPEDLIARLGCADFGGSYFTFSSENNYTIWAFLQKCHHQGFIYRGMDVMPWCFRCGTGLSQMEIAEGRKITRHTSVFVRFPLAGEGKRALLVWTTTPWTLTSNVAAAVNPDMTYLEVQHGDWIYYVGKGNYEATRLQDLEAQGKREKVRLQTIASLLGGSAPTRVLREVPGSDLVGLRYEGPFDHLPAQRRRGGVTPFGPSKAADQRGIDGHRVIAWDAVSESEGTGIVHIAPGCGAEDHQLGAREGLVDIAPLDENGRYVEGFDWLTGRHVLDVADDIVGDLRARGLLVAKETYPHVYPHCWRCKEELVFRLVDEWFIRMDWRDRIMKIVPTIRWIPADGEARELDWLRNMGDWMISKKRFWGLALPIWQCDEARCEWFTVIGGEEELRQKAIAGWDVFEGHSPHRPYIDAVKIRCEACGGVASRVEDVGNPWLDAGIVPFSTLHFRTDPDYWATWFPADFVVECFPGQFRNWFYALLAMSTIMDGRAPFKVLLGHGLVRDERGEEMHKSKGNAISFDEAAEVIGAEVMRYIYAAQNPTQNLNFPDIHHRDRRTHLDDEVRRKLLTLWNCYSFFVTYARADGWTPDRQPLALAGRPDLDRWILSRTQRLVEAAHRAFADYALYRFMDELERFEEELSNWYLRRSRRRFWRSESDRDKEAAYQTLYEVLVTTITLLAPILPFLTEDIYQNLVRAVDPEAPPSIHLRPYPTADAGRIDEELEERIALVIRTKNAGLALRNEAKIKVRQPLARLMVQPRDEVERRVLSDPDMAAQVAEECNVKSVELIDDASTLVQFRIKPNFKVLGPRLGRRVKGIANALAALDPATAADQLTREGRIELDPADGQGPVVLKEEELVVERESAPGLALLFDQGSAYALDTSLTPALVAEGLARDLNRLLQNLRRDLDLDVSDRVRIQLAAEGELAEAIEAHRAFLQQELLAEEIELTGALEGEDLQNISVGGQQVQVRMERVSP